jgi:hypothetical protein
MARDLSRDIEKKLKDAAAQPVEAAPAAEPQPVEAVPAAEPQPVETTRPVAAPAPRARGSGPAASKTRGDGYLEVRGPSGDDEPRFMRAAARVLAALAATAIVVAVAANIGSGPTAVGGGAAGSGNSVPGAASGSGAAAGGAGSLPRDAVSLLPSSVLGYETMARQPVPGSGGTAAEAVFATLSMSLELSAPIGVYARTEATASSDDASRRASEIIAGFPSQAKRFVIPGGLTAADSGYSRDRGSWVVVWTRGPYVIEVKAFFKDTIPANPKDFLSLQGEPVIEAIDRFLRTGKQQNMKVGG